MGQILTAPYDSIRHAVGFEPQELPDTYINEPDFLPAAEAHAMSVIPNWQLILGLGAPAAPGLAVVAGASTLLAAQYFVKLVARAGVTVSAPGAEASITTTLTNLQLIAITVPQTPGITGYDIYVGIVTGIEYLMIQNQAPGTTVNLTSFSMTGQSILAIGNDQQALRSAAIALTCAFLCRRFQRRQPKETRSLSFQERIDVDWREEEKRYFKDARYFFGLISTYVITPPAALNIAHPSPAPWEPGFVNSNPDANNPVGGPIMFPIGR